MNDGFLKWYQQTDEKEVQAWDKWIIENPEHRRLVNEAVQMLEFFRPARKSEITDQEIIIASYRLINAIQNNEN